MDFAGLGGNAAFETYALCCAILVLKMIASAVYTAVTRSRVKGYVNEEDATMLQTEAGAVEKPEVAHALRIQRNDLENVPLFFAIGLVYVLSGASAFWAGVWCWTFTISRCIHTVAYIRHMQPARAILWMIGTVSLVAMSLRVIATAL